MFWEFHYQQKPLNKIRSPIFLVQIIDSCNPHPAGYAPQPQINAVAQPAQTFIVTQVSSFFITPFTTVPSHCADRIVYNFGPNIYGQGGNSLTHNTNTNEIIFEYNQYTDIAGNSVNGEEYIVYIYGDLFGQTANAPTEVKVKNPCLDPTYYSIAAPTLPDFTYTLYDVSPNNFWTHTDPVITASVLLQ